MPLLRNSLLLTAALSTPLAAQAASPRYTLEVDTGFLTSTPAAGSGTTTDCFANDVDSSPLDTAFPNLGEELVSWGTKSCGGGDLVTEIELGYLASEALGVDTGHLVFAVYSGPTGFGALGEPVFSIELEGLPTANEQPVFLTLDLGAQSFLLPDGPIGWGYTNANGATSFLPTDIQVELGTELKLDWYRPGPAVDGHFFATVDFAPLYVVFRGLDDPVPASVTSLGSPANPDALVATAPALGATWTLTFQPLDPVSVEATLVFAALAPAVAPLPTDIGDLLLDPATLLSGSSFQTDLAHAFPLGTHPSQVGLQLTVQGALVGVQDLQLTNALVATLGL